MLKKLLSKIWGWLKSQRFNLWKYLMIAVHDVRKRPWFAVAAFVIAFNMWWWMGWRAGALWFLFVLFLLYEWENRIIGVLAIGSLITCPILLQFKHDDWAELMAVYAFFFLTMTVVLQIVEYKRHPERFPDEEDK